MRFEPTDTTMSFTRLSGGTHIFGLRCSFQAIGMMEEATGRPLLEIFGKGSVGISTLTKCFHAAMCAYNAHHSKPEPDLKFVYGMFDDGLDFTQAAKILSTLISKSSIVEDGKSKMPQSELDARFAADSDPLAETETPAVTSTPEDSSGQP